MPLIDHTTFRVTTDGPLLHSRGRYGAGEAQSEGTADGRLHERMHASTCLGVVVFGRFDFRTPIGAATATAGSMIFGHAGESFSYRYLDRRGARRAVIALSQELMSDAADYCGCPGSTFPVAAIPPQRATAALYGMARKVALTDRSLEEDVLRIVATALAMGREMRPRKPSRRELKRVLDVAGYIDVEYARPLHLADLAGMAQLSKFHFLRAFQTAVGESPGRYLIAARLRAAADRLIGTREAIASIALEVGFNDLSHFNSTFRTTFGASPRVWRNAAHG